MNNNAPINDGINAVSVYGQTDGMDDFPVLKAFQQYIDAEQAKARKRMVMLSVFFGVMIVVIIAVFAAMIHSVSERNQTLNDRLVDYVMKERDRQAESAARAAASVSAPSASEVTLKTMTDSLVAIQKELAEKKEVPTNVPSPQEIARKKQIQSEQDALASQRALLDAERKSLAEEREKLRQQEIEMHRRKLYPEYYQEKESATAKPNKAANRTKRTLSLSQADIDEILAEVDAVYEEEPEEKKTDAKPVRETSTKKSAEKSKPIEIEDDDDAIEYFNDDEYSLPVEIKGNSAGWKIPLK